MRQFAVVLLTIGLVCVAAEAQQKTALKAQKDKVSYCIGVDIGKNFNQQSIDVNLDLLLKGMKDALSNAKLLLTDQEMREVMMVFQSEMIAKMNEKTKKTAEQNKEEGDAFLAENKKKPGVVSLASGLQYKILKEGMGKSPKQTDTVTTHYRGTLISGKEFDSSYKRGEPTSFPLNGVIKGWTEALQLMKTGSKWQIFVPPQLAYSENGAGPDIGPNATLVFEIELLGIK